MMKQIASAGIWLIIALYGGVFGAELHPRGGDVLAAKVVERADALCGGIVDPCHRLECFVAVLDFTAPRTQVPAKLYRGYWKYILDVAQIGVLTAERTCTNQEEWEAK